MIQQHRISNFTKKLGLYRYPILVSVSILRSSTLPILVKYMLIPQHRYQWYVYVYDNFVEFVHCSET